MAVSVTPHMQLLRRNRLEVCWPLYLNDNHSNNIGMEFEQGTFKIKLQWLCSLDMLLCSCCRSHCTGDKEYCHPVVKVIKFSSPSNLPFERLTSAQCRISVATLGNNNNCNNCDTAQWLDYFKTCTNRQFKFSRFDHKHDQCQRLLGFDGDTHVRLILEGPGLLVDGPAIPQLGAGFLNMLSNGEDTDIVIQSPDGTEFQIIFQSVSFLCPISPLRTLVKEVREERIQIGGGISTVAVQEMLHFIYGKTPPLDQLDLPDLCHLISVAGSYEIEDLESLASTSLAQRIDSDNAMEFLPLAWKHGLDIVLHACFKQLKGSLDEVVKSEEWKKIFGFQAVFMAEVAQKF